MADIVNAAISNGKLGAVVARAGVGKTAFLVQAALYAMMTNRNVLHINLADTVKKTALWYEEMFSLMMTRCGKGGVGFPLTSLLSRRLIMTMKIAGFSVDSVRERLMDFIEQDVFSPSLIVLDGLNFDHSQHDTVVALKKLCGEMSIGSWISVPAHREEARDERQRPARFAGVADLFDVAWEFLPEGQKIQVRTLSTGDAGPADPGLYLNPSTLLLDVEAG
jgi:hypothetical protein